MTAAIADSPSFQRDMMSIILLSNILLFLTLLWIGFKHIYLPFSLFFILEQSDMVGAIKGEKQFWLTQVIC